MSLDTGYLDLRHMDADAMTLQLTAMLLEIQRTHPGMVERHGWVRLEDLQHLAAAIASASNAKLPER